MTGYNNSSDPECPFMVQGSHLSHPEVEPASPLLGSGWPWNFLWPLECVRGDTVQHLKLGLQRPGNFHVSFWNILAQSSSCECWERNHTEENQGAFPWTRPSWILQPRSSHSSQLHEKQKWAIPAELRPAQIANPRYHEQQKAVVSLQIRGWFVPQQQITELRHLFRSFLSLSWWNCFHFTPNQSWAVRNDISRPPHLISSLTPQQALKQLPTCVRGSSPGSQMLLLKARSLPGWHLTSCTSKDKWGVEDERGRNALPFPNSKGNCFIVFIFLHGYHCWPTARGWAQGVYIL